MRLSFRVNRLQFPESMMLKCNLRVQLNVTRIVPPLYVPPRADTKDKKITIIGFPSRGWISLITAFSVTQECSPGNEGM